MRGDWDYTQHSTATTTMTSAFRWAAMRAILTFRLLWGTKSQDGVHKSQLIKRESWNGIEPMSCLPVCVRVCVCVWFVCVCVCVCVCVQRQSLQMGPYQLIEIPSDENPQLFIYWGYPLFVRSMLFCVRRLLAETIRDRKPRTSTSS